MKTVKEAYRREKIKVIDHPEVHTGLCYIFFSIYVFGFSQKEHATTMLAGNMPYVLGVDEKRLQKLYLKYEGKRIDRMQFLFETMGLNGIKVFVREAKGYVKRKLVKKSSWEASL